METVIIMTDRISAFGSKYVDFMEKETGTRVGEVDRVEGKYIIFCGPSGWLSEIGTRTNKNSAIRFLQDAVRAGYSTPVEFKWNVIVTKEKVCRRY